MIFDGPYFAYHDKGETHSEYTSFLGVDAAKELNQKGYAIAIIPNLVVGGRANSNVTKIRAWFCDIDFDKDAIKPSAEDLVEVSPLIPSYIVETKNGYHVYFLCSHQFAPDEIYLNQQKAIVEYFNADKKCINFARLMRAPGFLHQKEEPFMVDIVFKSKAVYAPIQINMAFPQKVEDENDSTEKTESVGASQDNIFDKIRHYDSRLILQALSQTKYVSFKKYSFRPKGNNHYNIIVDGKDSGCFINEKGNLIASDGYCGGVVEWLGWYGLNRVDAMRAVCEVMGWG